jgi:hypothetical protein
MASDRRSGDVGRPLHEEVELDAKTVRPYTVTRGRTRASQRDLALETLVRCTGLPGAPGPAPSGGPEHRRILELVADRILSVAELSAHLHVPLGVTRVLVGDLVDEGLVAVHGGAEDSLATSANLKVLESVLNGISSL